MFQAVIILGQQDDPPCPGCQRRVVFLPATRAAGYRASPKSEMERTCYRQDCLCTVRQMIDDDLPSTADSKAPSFLFWSPKNPKQTRLSTYPALPLYVFLSALDRVVKLRVSEYLESLLALALGMTLCSGCASLWVTLGRQGGDGMRRNKYSVVRPQSNKEEEDSGHTQPEIRTGSAAEC